jgi:hypothetical protein
MIARQKSPSHQLNGNDIGGGCDRELGQLFDAKYEGVLQHGHTDVFGDDTTSIDNG